MSIADKARNGRKQALDLLENRNSNLFAEAFGAPRRERIKLIDINNGFAQAA